MKKKLALIAFTIVCTIGLTLSIASFTLGSENGSGSSDSGDNLKDIYDSYYTQIDHIVDNSNLANEEDAITNYHIVQIVDTDTATDAAGNKLSEYLSNYINNAEDADDLSEGYADAKEDAEESSLSHNFRTDIISKAMKSKHIDIQTYVASDPALADAIRNADLIYIACNALQYNEDNDFKEDESTSNAVDALRNYAMSEFKPVLIDSDVVGVTNQDVELDDSHSTLIYDYLNNLKNTQGQHGDNGVASVKNKTVSWKDYFNGEKDKSTYVKFNNKGTAEWNTYDYSSSEPQHKVLEIVPDDNTPTPSNFETMVKSDEFKEAFINKTSIDPAKHIQYERKTVADLNSEIETWVASGNREREFLYQYDFIYISHQTNDPVFYYQDDNKGHTQYDYSSKLINALKGFAAKDNTYNTESGTVSEKHYVDRLMIDGNFFSVYSYGSNNGGNGKVNTNTKIYKLATELISNDASAPLLQNVEIAYRGYFKSDEMTREKANAVTTLINRSTYRNFSASGNGTTFKVLEIEPYYTVDDTSWYTTASGRDKLTDTLANPKDQEISEALNNMGTETPFYRFNMTAARIAAATGLNINQIKVTSMSANALCSTSMNLSEDYDMIYIGGNHSNIKDTSEWYANSLLTDKSYIIGFNLLDIKNAYNKPEDGSSQWSNLKHNSYLYPSYSHTGEFTNITDQFNSFNNDIGDTYKQSVTRLNGNDLTARMYAKLYAYIEGGLPVVCDKSVIDSDYLIGGASANANLVEAKVEETGASGATTTKSYQIKVDKTTTLNRLGLDATKNVNATFKANGNTVSFIETTYSSDTMTARRESSIDPESYMYQLLYQIAEDKTSPIYHADNVFVGFDSNDLVTISHNRYLMSVTSDADETVPEDETVLEKSDKKTVILSGLDSFTNKDMTIFSNKVVKKPLTGAIDYANSGSGIQLKHFLNQKATARAVINLIKAPKDYDSSRDMDKKKRVVNDKNPVYSFSINGVKGATYKVQLYYDFDGDGKFSDDKTEGRLEDSEYADEVVATCDYTIGTDGIVVFDVSSDYVETDFKIDKDFIGVMPYKLVITDTATGKKTSVTGYPKYYSDKEENKQNLRILEIIPGRADACMGNLNNSVTTLCAHENTLKNGAEKNDWANLGAVDNGKHEFGITSASDSSDNLASRLFDEYTIDLNIMTTGQFSELASYYILDYCKNFEKYAARDSLTEAEISSFESFMGKYYDSGNKQMKDSWNEMVKLTNDTVIDFNKEGICEKIFCSWLRNGDKTNKVTIGTKAAYSEEKQSFDVGGYDMVVMGFARKMGGDVYHYSDINNIGCQFIRAYVEASGPILLGTDITSYAPFYDNGTMYWSRNINQYLRKTFYMDRFKLDYGQNGVLEERQNNTEDFYNYYKNGQGANGNEGWSYLYVPYTTDDYESKNTDARTKGKDVMPGEFFTTNSYDGTYEKGTSNDFKNDMAGAGATDSLAYGKSSSGNTIFKDLKVTQTGQDTNVIPSTRVARNNVGLVTNYPFTISAYPRISAANGQCLALDTEDEDMQIWYTLAGAGDSESVDSGLYAADALNGRSYYYIYTCRNVTYSGAGYTTFAETADNDEERKLIINAILSNVKIHRSGPSVVFYEYTGDEPNDSKFTPAKGSQPAILECPSQNKDQCNFDFKITPNKNLKNVCLFIDNDGDGIYKEGVDTFILDLTDEAEAAAKAAGEEKDSDKKSELEKIIVSGKDLPDVIDSFMQSGNFELTISATDEEDRIGSSRLLVKTKSKLFNLN